MIPNNISREDILRAISQISREGTPKGRKHKNYVLEFESNYYPPKYVISIANKYANGKELAAEDFSGGAETNNFLIKKGFTIVKVSGVSEKKKVFKSCGYEKKTKEGI